jgi:hypothetical protein
MHADAWRFNVLEILFEKYSSFHSFLLMETGPRRILFSVPILDIFTLNPQIRPIYKSASSRKQAIYGYRTKAPFGLFGVLQFFSDFCIFN